jgi:hypothetical protein
MAIVLDVNLLNEIGLGSLPQAEQKSLLDHIYETLEMRVGMRLADQMTNEQLDEFDQYYQTKDDNGAFKWLETNFPNYKEIVQEEFDKLKEEVRLVAPQILQATPTGQAVSGTSAVPPQAVQNGNDNYGQQLQQQSPVPPLSNNLPPQQIPPYPPDNNLPPAQPGNNQSFPPSAQ